jgi:hypothetical protein
MASVKRRPDGTWRARYRDPSGREHARHFPRRVDAERWLDGVRGISPEDCGPTQRADASPSPTGSLSTTPAPNKGERPRQLVMRSWLDVISCRR